MLQGVNIEFGGKMSAEDRYIEPTVLTDVKGDEPVMQHEVCEMYTKIGACLIKSIEKGTPKMNQQMHDKCIFIQKYSY